jgi:hypothetical protein
MLLQVVSGAAVSALAVQPAAAQHEAHDVPDGDVSEAAGIPRALTPHEFETLGRLTDLVLPARGTQPGATQAGAAVWIDRMCATNDQLLAVYTGGLAWLDHAMEARGASSFVAASDAQQRALLDTLAYAKNHTPDVLPGVRFFQWVRRMTVDAFYTSKIGTEALGYQGNRYLAAFAVPQNVIDAMNRKSPL